MARIPRAIVVEDDARMRRIITKVLGSCGMQVRAASDGLEALEAFAQNPAETDLICADIKMPNMDGMEFARRLRQQGADVPIIFVSGTLQTSQDGYREKSHLYLMSKPFSPMKLAEVAKEMLAKPRPQPAPRPKPAAAQAPAPPAPQPAAPQPAPPPPPAAPAPAAGGRGKVVASVAAVAVAALLGTGVWSYVRILGERDAAVAAREEAEDKRREAEAAQDEALRQKAEAEKSQTEAIAAATREKEAIRKRMELEIKAARINTELKVATQVQLSLLPGKLPRTPGFDAADVLWAAKEVTRDYYDYLSVDRKNLGVLVASSSDKGIPGAILMAETRAVVRMLAEGETSPMSLLRKANQVMARDIKRGSYATATYGVLNVLDRTLKVASAGGEAVVWYRSRTKQCELLKPKGSAGTGPIALPEQPGQAKFDGIPLGVDKGRVFNRVVAERAVQLESGDRVVFCSGGVIAVKNERGEPFGKQRLLRCIQDNSRKSSKEIVRAVVNSLRKHVRGGEQSEDFTVIVIGVTGEKRKAPTSPDAPEPKAPAKPKK